MATLCPECMKMPIESLLNSKGEMANPGCSTCDGSCTIGDPDECSDDIPLCYGRALNGTDNCTCENGFLAKAERFADERWDRTLRYLLKQADARLGMYERVIWEQAHDRHHLAGLMVAQAALAELAPVIKGKRAQARKQYAGGSHYDIGHLGGYDQGLREGRTLLRAAITRAIRQHQQDNDIPHRRYAWSDDLHNTSGELRPQIARQLKLF